MRDRQEKILIHSCWFVIVHQIYTLFTSRGRIIPSHTFPCQSRRNFLLLHQIQRPSPPGLSLPRPLQKCPASGVANPLPWETSLVPDSAQSPMTRSCRTAASLCTALGVLRAPLPRLCTQTVSPTHMQVKEHSCSRQPTPQASVLMMSIQVSGNLMLTSRTELHPMPSVHFVTMSLLVAISDTSRWPFLCFSYACKTLAYIASTFFRRISVGSIATMRNLRSLV